MLGHVELLAPAGSHEALLAAVEAGADAVYLGGEFNARAYARNFDRQAMAEAFALCHAYGVKAYVTLNTAVFERELEQWLSYAQYLWQAGADAFIVADIGAALTLKKYIPDVRLHASTQMTVHNSEGVRALASLGFERVVVARELSRENITSIVKNTGTEIEMFVHGALCVSVSGQCLFSSLVGGRSGNRGECAQPCRLNYNGAPILSLKDNCLASHMTEILDMGVSSLKVEGRMKTPEYVYGTVSVYRRLLDQRRNAEAGEIAELERLFCRSGFTDGYFTGNTAGMCGVRTDSDKKKSEGVARFSGLERKAAVEMSCEIKRDEPMSLEVRSGSRCVRVQGAVASPAQNAPIDRDTVKRSITKLGGTPYECNEPDISLDGGVYVRVSELNALRRDAIAALDAAGTAREVKKSEQLSSLLSARCECEDNTLGASCRFVSKQQLADSGVTAEDVARIYLPLSEYDAQSGANGVIFPPLVYDGEWECFAAEARRARELGAVYAVCSNISQLRLARELGYIVTADFRFNITNTKSAELLRELGAEELILSPELKLGAIKDIKQRKSVAVYGKIPLMLTEKCAIKEAGGCAVCKGGKPYYLTDRTGARFAAFGIDGHRCMIYNSVPTYMADCRRELCRIGSYASHFIFSDESDREIRDILSAYREGRAYSGKFRRI